MSGGGLSAPGYVLAVACIPCDGRCRASRGSARAGGLGLSVSGVFGIMLCCVVHVCRVTPWRGFELGDFTTALAGTLTRSVYALLRPVEKPVQPGD